MILKSNINEEISEEEEEWFLQNCRRRNITVKRSLYDDTPTFTITSDSASQAPEVKPLNLQRVIFEPMGKLVGTLSYVHLNIDLKYDKFLEQVLLYEGRLKNFEALLTREMTDLEEVFQQQHHQQGKLIQAAANLSLRILHGGQSFDDALRTIRGASQIITLEQHSLDIMKRKIDLINTILPRLSGREEKSTSAEDNSENSEAPKSEVKSRPKRLVMAIGAIAAGVAGAALGTTGTILGSFNQREINRLSQQLTSIQEGQDKLITIVADQEKFLQKLQQGLNKLNLEIELLTKFNPGTLHAQFSYQRELLQHKVDQIFETIQAAELHRLAPQALDAGMLTAAFDRLQKEANKRSLEMVAQEPGHLFQLETTLARRGEAELSLIVHVPLIRPEHVYHLMRYHAFPMVFQQETSVIIHSEDKLLALGQRNEHFTLTLEDLELCKHFHELYLCELQSVIKLSPATSCLGSIHEMHEGGVRKHCQIRSGNNDEIAYQVSPTQFVIFVPEALRTTSVCPQNNITHFHFQGYHKVTLGHGCVCDLRHHRLTTGTSIRAFSGLTHFDWDWNPLVDFEGIPRERIYEGLKTSMESESRGILLTDLKANLLKAMEEDHRWKFTNVVMFLGLGFGLMAILLLLCVCSVLYRRRQELREWAKKRIYSWGSHFSEETADTMDQDLPKGVGHSIRQQHIQMRYCVGVEPGVRHQNVGVAPIAGPNAPFLMPEPSKRSRFFDHAMSSNRQEIDHETVRYDEAMPLQVPPQHQQQQQPRRGQIEQDDAIITLN